jgi:hypothetical protein
LVDCTGEEGGVTSSAADEWDLVVPSSGEELLAELDSHGVKPGHRLHLRVVSRSDEAADSRRDQLWDAFIGSGGNSGDPDLSVKAEDVLRAEMGA